MWVLLQVQNLGLLGMMQVCSSPQMAKAITQLTFIKELGEFERELPKVTIANKWDSYYQIYA